MAVADDLSVTGVDFLLENDRTGGRVWVPTPASSGITEELGMVVPDSVNP